MNHHEVAQKITAALIKRSLVISGSRTVAIIEDALRAETRSQAISARPAEMLQALK